MFVPFADYLNHGNVEVTFDVYVKEEIKLPERSEEEIEWESFILGKELLDGFNLFSDELTWEVDPPAHDSFESKYSTIW